MFKPMVYAFKDEVHWCTETTHFDFTLVRAPTPYMVDLRNSRPLQDITSHMKPGQAKMYS